MQYYIRANKFRDDTVYTVYNSQGLVALYTRNRSLAQQLAKAFEQQPDCTEVIVAPVARCNARS